MEAELGNEVVLLRGQEIFSWEKGLFKEISQRWGTLQGEETSVLLPGGTAA